MFLEELNRAESIEPEGCDSVTVALRRGERGFPHVFVEEYEGSVYGKPILFVVVVLTLTHRHNAMQSVVGGQAPITLELEEIPR